MGLFKNGVGRPSNETLRKRKIVYTSLVVGAVALLSFGCCFLCNLSKSDMFSYEKNIKTKALVYGDVDGDERVAMNDATAIKLFLEGKGTIQNTYPKAADVDMDGKISENDASLIQLYLNETIKALPVKYGDVNNDSKIDGNDINLIQNYLTKKGNLTNEQKILADVDLSGKVNIYDVTEVQFYIAGKRSKLPTLGKDTVFKDIPLSLASEDAPTVTISAYKLGSNKKKTGKVLKTATNVNLEFTNWVNYQYMMVVNAKAKKGTIKSIKWEITSSKKPTYKDANTAQSWKDGGANTYTYNKTSVSKELGIYAEGVRLGKVTVTDSYGNSRTIMVRFNIDRSAPKVSFDWKTATFDAKGRIAINSKVNVVCNDSLSGSKLLRVNEGLNTDNGKTSRELVSLNLTRSGLNYLIAECKDAVGNSSGNKKSEIKRVVDKKVKVAFDKNGASKIGAISLSCEKETINSSCKIKMPSITAKSGFEVVGWATSSTATTASAMVGQNVSVDENVTYYAITKSRKAYKATFDPRTAYIGSGKVGVKSSKSCYCYNGSSTCSISIPRVKSSSGKTFVGWTTDKNATSSKIKQNSAISINKDTIYYALIKETLTATFDKNDADSLSFYSSSCVSYGAGCKITKVPYIYRKGYEVAGFDTKVLNKTITKNTTFKAKTDTNFHRKTIGIATTYKISGVPIDVENSNTLPANVYEKYYDELVKVESKMPYLFDFNGKIHMLSQNTYNSIRGNSAGRVFKSSPFTNIDVLITNAYEEYKVSTFVHELGHAFDYYYGYQTGKNISKQDDVVALYEKHKQSKKYMRQYSYTNTEEFVADLICYYYYTKYKTNVNNPKGGIMSSDMITTIEEYIKIAKNGYK